MKPTTLLCSARLTFTTTCEESTDQAKQKAQPTQQRRLGGRKTASYYCRSTTPCLQRQQAHQRCGGTLALALGSRSCTAPRALCTHQRAGAAIQPRAVPRHHATHTQTHTHTSTARTNTHTHSHTDTHTHSHTHTAALAVPRRACMQEGHTAYPPSVGDGCHHSQVRRLWGGRIIHSRSRERRRTPVCQVSRAHSSALYTTQSAHAALSTILASIRRATCASTHAGTHVHAATPLRKAISLTLARALTQSLSHSVLTHHSATQSLARAVRQSLAQSLTHSPHSRSVIR